MPNNPIIPDSLQRAQKYIIPVAWLHITGYMHDWLFNEFGGSVRLHGKPVVSISHLPGARDVLRMETHDDMTEPATNRLSLSSMRMDCIMAGSVISKATVEQMYGVTSEQVKMFIPVECPKMALTKYGVLRPWSRTIAFGKRQATALYRLLFNAFWKRVEDYDEMLRESGIVPETAISMIEGFCEATGTSEVWAEDLRREWQRRVARKKAKS